MTIYEQARCKKCSLCVQDDNGEWICTEDNIPIEFIDDESCPVEQDY